MPTSKSDLERVLRAKQAECSELLHKHEELERDHAHLPRKVLELEAQPKYEAERRHLLAALERCQCEERARVPTPSAIKLASFGPPLPEKWAGDASDCPQREVVDGAKALS
jgi:hypothetical protein